MDLELLLNIFNRSKLEPLSPETAFENVKMIFECVRLHIDPNKIDECLGQIFSEENGLQYFLVKYLTNKSFNSSKEQILRLFRFILINEQNHKGWEDLVSPFCNHFMTVARLYWRNSNEPAKHQQLALDCLIAILDNYGKLLDESASDIPALYWELLASSEKSAFQPSVRGRIFHALGGVMSLTHSTLFARDDCFQQLYRHIILTVKGQVESTDAHLEVNLIHGCLKAMDKLCQFSSSKIDRDGKDWKQFYSNLIQIVDPKCSILKDTQRDFHVIKRREFQRAGLELIANNGVLLNKELFNNYNQWYFDLISWSKSSNSNDSSVGKRAMFSYLKAIFNYAKSETDVLESEFLDRFVSFFVESFEEILASDTPRRNETIVAITGIGLLSPLCNNTTKVGVIADRIFDNVGRIVFELNNPIGDKYSGSLSMVSTYLETISGLMLHVMEEETEPTANLKFLSRLNQVEQLAIHFLLRYPRLSAYQRKTAHHCFLKIVHCLHSKYPHHSVPFIDRTLAFVLLQVIASPTTAELGIIDDALKASNESQDKQGSKSKDRMELHGVSSYIGIWTSIANSTTESIAAKLVYDRVLSWAILTIEKLDLTMISVAEDNDDQEQHPSDIFSCMQAVKPKDFQLLINLIEFLQTFLTEVKETMFSGWEGEFLTKVIDHAVKNPFVSGFYKIIGTALEISGKLNFFALDSAVEAISQVQEKCGVFMKSALIKMDTFRDDLLLSVLELWLSIPDEILIHNLESWCLTLEKIFKMGRMHLPLADKCADALQRWMMLDSIPRNVIEDIVIKLFPLWQSYFLTEGLQPSNNFAMSKYNKREEVDMARKNADDEILMKIQVKLLKVIGSFGHVIDLESDHSMDISLDQNYNVLKLKIPFGQETVDIYLDFICPRVFKLCEDSASRQVRITACEFLHTIFLYFLGNSVRSNTSGTQSIDLFAKMFRTILKLSGDGDFLIRQIFNPLASQCIHWFTKNSSAYSEAILQMLVDGLVSDDAQLHDFSADCLYEFFKWALKHDTKPLVRDVLQFIMALSSHSNSKFRLGACVAFNAIYRDFREDLELVNSYSIILLTGFITSLSITKDVDEDSIIITATKISISHLQRIISKKKDNFNNNIGKRKKPYEFRGETVQFSDLAYWLTRQLGRAERICREECSRLMKVMGPMVKGCGSVEAFLASCAHDIDAIIQAGERSFVAAFTGNINELLSFLDAASEFYEFFNDHNSLNLSVLQHPTSGFITQVLIMFSQPVANYEPVQLNVIARICVRLKKLYQFLEESQRNEFHKFLINISGSMVVEDDMANILQILVQFQSDWRQEVRMELIHRFSYKEIEKLLDGKNFLQLRWLRLAAESKLVEAIIGITGDVQTLVDLIWKDLLKKLFGSQDDDSYSTSRNSDIYEPNSDELNEQLKICLALGIDGDILVDAAFDPQQLGDTTKSNKPRIPMTRGEIFQKFLVQGMFHPTLLDFNRISMRIKIESVGSYIEFLLATIRCNKFLRQKSGNLLFENVIKVWMPISVNCDNFTVVRILSSLVWLDLERSRDSVELCHWWCGKDAMGSNLDLAELMQFVGFLGLFGQSKDSRVVELVINTTEKVIDSKFPIGHQDCITGLVKQILVPIVFEHDPKNLKILKLLSTSVLKISTLTGDGVEMNFLLKDIAKRLFKFSRSGNEKDVIDASTTILEAIMTAVDYDNNRNLFLYCLCPVVFGMQISVSKLFFKGKIKLLMDNLQDNSAKTSIPSLFQLNVSRTVYNLLTIIPKRYGTKLLDELTAEYKRRQGMEGIPDSSRNSILKVISSSFAVIKQRSMASTNVNPKLHEALLRCHSSAYNALAATLIVSENLPNHQKIMEGLLIHEDRSKGKYLWETFVDCSKSVQDYFPIVIEPQSDKPNIEEHVEAIIDDVVPTDTSSSLYQSVKARINLANSSLVGEGSYATFDFTGAFPLTETGFYQRFFDVSTEGTGDGPPSQQARKPPTVTVKSVAFSDESVEGLVSTIKKLITFCSPEKNEHQEQPWMKYLRDALLGSHHDNVKVFILLALLNCQEGLKLYAKSFIVPICKVIMSDFWKEPFNYFVKDVLVMLLSWSEVAIPSVDGTFNPRQEICRFIINNIIEQDRKHSRNDLLENNLSLLDAVVRVWKIETSELSTSPILDILRCEVPKVGVMICTRIFRNNILPLEDPLIMLRQFCKLLDHSSKAIYSDAADCLGLLLNFLEKGNYQDIGEVTKYVTKKLREARKLRMPAFLVIVKQIQKSFPQITALFHDELMEMLGKTLGSRADIIDILFSSLLLHTKSTLDSKSAVINFISNLNGRNVFHTACTLQDAELGVSIFEVFVKYPDTHLTPMFMKMLTWLNVLQQDIENPSLQSRYYKCTSEVYFRCTLNESDKERILQIFTNAFMYENSEIKTSVDEFWLAALENCKRPQDLFVRLLELCGNEANSLEIILGRILQRCSIAPEFDKTVFDKPLDDCLFHEYNLDTSSKMKQASFLPLFAESISSQPFTAIPQALQASVMRQGLNVSHFGVNLLRASMSLRQQQFSPTIIEPDLPITFLASNIPSTRMEIDEPSQNPRVQKDPLSHLKKRFYNRPMESNYFAARHANLQEEKMKITLDQLKSKQNMRVNRTYRIGEIPDIMIKHCDILTTMIKLGQCDNECARLLVGQIFSNIYNVLEESSNIGSIFDTALQNPRTSGILIATIMDISIRNKTIISPCYVTSVCAQHNLYELGIILLENCLAATGKSTNQPSLPKKRRIESQRDFEETSESVLLNIAYLYSQLEEVDVLKTILAKASENPDSSKISVKLSNAFSLESIAKFDAAIEEYVELFEDSGKYSDSQKPYAILVESSLFKCLSKLSEWSQLMDIVGKPDYSSNNENKHCDNRHSTGKSLTVRAGLMLALKNQTHANIPDLNQFVNKLQQSGSQYYIEEALLLLCADSQNTNKCAILLEKFWPKGITAFANFSKLSLPQKNEQILQYQLASTLNDILSWYKNVCETNVKHKTTHLLSKYHKLIGSDVAPFFNSQMMIATRSFFVDKLLHHVLLVEDEVYTREMSLLNFHQHLWVLSLGIRDKFLAADKYLDSSRSLGDDVSSIDFLEWRKVYVSYLACFRHLTPLDEWIAMWGSAWKKVRIGSSASQESEPNEIILMQSGLLRSLVCCLEDNQYLRNTSFKCVNSALGIKSSPNPNISDAIKAGTSQLLSLVEQSKNTILSPTGSFQLYKLMEELCRSFPDTYASNTDSLALLLESLLRSMSSENDEAVLGFPRLLDLIEHHPQLHPTFLASWGGVPIWKWIPWLDQVIATHLCNSEMHRLLQPVVQKIAEVYPDALRLQYPHLIPTCHSQSHHNDYISSLKALVLPTVAHKEAMDAIVLKIKGKDVISIHDSIRTFHETMQNILNNKNIYGSIHLHFAQEVLGVLRPYLTSLEHSSTGRDSKAEDVLVEVKDGIEAIRMSHEKRIFSDRSGSFKIKELKEFSPWLSKFHHIQTKDVIKFPGLFDQLSVPDVDSHPSIVSFNPTVQIYRSITFPIRMTILGNDGKRRSFLIKYGDDLRQDRHLQQLFRVANSFFVKNSETRQRKINISTYSVVPITDSFGIIEWLDKTLNVSSFIFKTKQLESQQNTAAKTYQSWVEKVSGLKPPRPIYQFYAGAAKNATRQEAECHFDSLVSLTSDSLLSDNLIERCRSYEQFFKVRQNFIRSYAAMCIVHWLLGIGDRHLQNSLLSLETGKVIGIDFGRAFELTNSDQPIPEMIPFRLTPNFQNLMMPYGYNGLFRETMCISWKSLLEWSDTILFIIKTFVNEHNLKWTNNRNADVTFDNAPQTSTEWIPMQTLQRKLSCKNPINILLKTLETNRWEEIVPIYCDIVKNGREVNTDDDSTVSHDQVIDCLLDLATDKNILARLYVGLLPFV